MEEDMSSIVSATGTVEAADSTSTARSTRRTRNGPGKFKGVVPQQNGHWGAQIYANHQRVWLGTFKSEAEATMAYDSAAIRIRRGDAHRNFPWTQLSLHEPAFQGPIPTDELLKMIKDGSYRPNFHEFLARRFGGSGDDVAAAAPAGGEGLGLRLLFEKELTPSDVGKLNRLVIPKKHAVKHFPGAPAGGDDTQLEFRDVAMRTWKFRYCYWKSSQSYVFTRGWSRFVREKRLREGDSVAFYSGEQSGPAGPVLVIDTVRAQDSAGNENENENKESVEGKEVIGEAGNSGFRLFGVFISGPGNC